MIRTNLVRLVRQLRPKAPALRDALLIVGCLALAGPAYAYDPWRVPAGPARDRLRTIAIRPVVAPLALENHAALVDSLQRVFAEALEERGYEVVGADEFERVWVDLAKTVGPIFDPTTGVADTTREAAVREHTARELARRYSVDAILDVHATIADVEPRLVNGLYHAGDEPLLWNGSPLNVLPQKVNGYFVGVLLYDLAGTELYNIRQTVTWTSIYAARGYESRPEADVFLDHPRNLRAAQSCLYGLRNLRTDGPPPTPTAATPRSP